MAIHPAHLRRLRNFICHLPTEALTESRGRVETAAYRMIDRAHHLSERAGKITDTALATSGAAVRTAAKDNLARGAGFFIATDCTVARPRPEVPVALRSTGASGG